MSAERVAESPPSLTGKVPFEIDAGVIEKFPADLNQRAVLVRAESDLTERRVRNGDCRSLRDDSGRAVARGLRDLNRLAAVRVQDRRTGLHDGRDLDQMFHESFVERRRDRVPSGRRRQLGQRAIVDRTLRHDVEVPATLATEEAPKLVVRLLRLALLRRLRLLLAANRVEEIVGVTLTLLGVERRPDPDVEPVDLFVQRVPLALFLGRERPVLVGSGLGKSLRFLPDSKPSLAKLLDNTHGVAIPSDT